MMNRLPRLPPSGLRPKTQPRAINSFKNSKKVIPIQELATNPLLLTLLCLMFEESADFPSNRSELYKEGLNVLLRKWDAKRSIEREQSLQEAIGIPA